MKAYAERYWEKFNEIDGDFDEVAIRTFKVGFPPEHGLRKSLLFMSMREGESVKAYAERYWEMFNEIDGDFDEVAIRTFEVAIKTFKVGLPSERGLRKSLIGKPVTSLR